ncbi:hypothetical protein C8R47DRAFT_1146031, partial [Mycena vitilis]
MRIGSGEGGVGMRGRSRRVGVVESGKIRKGRGGRKKEKENGCAYLCVTLRVPLSGPNHSRSSCASHSCLRRSAASPATERGPDLLAYVHSVSRLGFAEFFWDRSELMQIQYIDGVSVCCVQMQGLGKVEGEGRDGRGGGKGRGGWEGKGMEGNGA